MVIPGHIVNLVMASLCLVSNFLSKSRSIREVNSTFVKALLLARALALGRLTMFLRVHIMAVILLWLTEVASETAINAVPYGTYTPYEWQSSPITKIE